VSVTRGEVDRIAELALLRLQEGEAERLTREMNRILEHADRLRSVAGDLDARPGDGASEGGEVGTDSLEVLTGVRVRAAEEPDPLGCGPSDFAPRFKDGFFLVPPPRGVQAEP
jgi:Asp-tRNA(Asn)/Glu-tRNA(Gln) amidotransferase C subunit